MDEAKRKQFGQIAILVVLLVGLGVAVVMMVSKQGGKSKGGATKAAASKTAATDMAQTGVAAANGGGASSVPSPSTSNASKLNPNMWRVYALSPPRNPFVQEESWYASTFKKMLPGYPELKDWLNKPGDVLPDIHKLFGDKVDFDKIELSRTFSDQTYTVQGASEDGKMQTSLTAHVKQPENISQDFDAQGNKIAKFIPGAGAPGAGDVPLGRTPRLPGGSDDGGLPPNAQGSGEALGCTGISFHNGHASALMTFNGASYIVNEGGSIPPQYTSAHIVDNGVQLKDSKTGKTKFVELKAPSKDDKMPDFTHRGGMQTIMQP
jgi:hypothetical protein